ncbi:MAG: Fic family protein [Polyangiales bacterium]
MVQALQGGSLEERVAYLQELQGSVTQADREGYAQRLDMSWIYHDSALDGVVYSSEELEAAVSTQVVSDSSLIPVYDEIRQHKAAIDLVRSYAAKKRLVISLDIIKKIFVTLAPDEVEGKGAPTYRKDMPVHRLYFHDIAPPDKISYRMRQLVQWVNAPENKRAMHVVRLGAKAHMQLLQIYPFIKHSGKVSRLLLNMILLHHGYPPAILHATERQRYYDALRGAENTVSRLVNDALISSVESGIRYFESLRRASVAR